MDFIRKDPQSAYYSNALFLPKLYFSQQQLASALTYDLDVGQEPFVAYKEDSHHYIVPRNFIAPSSLAQLPFRTIDARIRTYPRVHFQSKVQLDLKSQGLTYQREGVSALLQANHGVLSLRCGAGKSVCAIHAIHKLEVPGLVIVNDLGLAEQWIREIITFTDLERQDIGLIGDGKFDWQKKLTIATAHSLANRVKNEEMPRELVEHFGVVCADEAHTTAGPAFYHLALTPFHGRRWGLSATPHRSDAFRSLVHYTVGHVVYKYLTPELTPLIYFRSLPTTINKQDPLVRRAVCDRSGEEHLSRIYSYLATRQDRNAHIIQEIQAAIRQKRQVLVLSQSLAMLDTLAQAFPKAGVLNGKVAMSKRHDVLANSNPVLAISKLGRQALNKPVLDTLFVCEPYTDAGVLQQLIGRIQRPHPDKQQPVAVFYDDVNVDRLHGMCMKIRKLFNHWPEDQGGRLRWQITGAAT